MNLAPAGRSPLPKWLYYATLALVFLAPSQLGYAVTKKDGPFIAYADVLGGLLCLAALLVVALGRRWRQLRYPPLAAVAFVVIAGLSLSQAVHPLSGLVKLVQWPLYLIGFYMLFVNVLTDRRRVLAALTALAGATALVVVWAATQYVRTPDPASAPGGIANPLVYTPLWHVQAGFDDRNIYCAFLALVLPVLLALALHARGWKWRLGAAAVVAVGVVTMLSGPLLWVTLLALVGVALTSRGKARWAVPVAVVVFVALMPVALPRNWACAVTELGQVYEGQMLKIPGGPGEATEVTVPVVKKRWLEWQPALRMLSDHLILGVGAGNYQANIGEAYQTEDVSSVFDVAPLPNVKKGEPDTNNLYLVIGGSMGFAGLVCLIGVLAYFWRQATGLWAVAEDRLGRGLAAGLPAALFALMVGNLFTAMFVRGLSLIIVLLFALAEVSLLRAGDQSRRDSRHLSEEG
ncbi:MAG TPA: O-antigen ligase family protein [Armatimonadota bacterium]|jgi:hypothetical protein